MDRSSKRGLVGVLVALTIGLIVAPGSVAAHDSGVGQKSKVPPSNPPHLAASKDSSCTLSPSLNHSGGEFTSCISVGAHLSSVPTVGQKATLTVTVKAARREPNTFVSVSLPPTFRFADGTVTQAAVSGAGPVARATIAKVNMAAGKTKTFTRVVQAVAAGFGEIAVSASNRLSAKRTDGGADSVFATVASAGGTSFLGGGPASSAAHSLSTARVSLKSSGPYRKTSKPLKKAPVTVTGATRMTAMRPHTAGTSCATGTWNYEDQNSLLRPAGNTLVEVLNSSNALLSYAVSSPGTGGYTICWSTGGATTSVYVKFVESNNIWKVTDNSGNVYSFSTAIVAVPDGTTHSFGNLLPSGSANYRALHAFDIANDDWQWVHQYFAGQCWNPFTSSCLQLTIHWQSDSTTGTFWNTTGVYLLAGSPDTVDEPAHEVGHDIMYETYGNSYPATTNCNPHFLFTISSTTCAFTEGWADWVATSVYNNTTWTFNGGSTTKFDTTWGDGQDTGDQVEGRIVQAMRSLTDGVKGPWDNDPGEGAGVRDNRKFFAILHTYEPNTFASFWSDRGVAGHDVSQTALSALYQGTIDYGFRNPLATSVGRHFPEAVPDHNYSAGPTSGFWSLVAEKPDSGSDTDLSVFTDFGQTTLLDSSAFGGPTTDFVALNTNSGHLAAGTYYPRVHQFNGTGGYSIEFVAGSSVLSEGTTTAAMDGSHFVQIRDSFQDAGVPVSYRAVPDPGVDVQLAVASADLNSAPRSSTTTSLDPGAGVPVTLVYTPTVTGWHGLILLDDSLTAGNVTVYADTTAPNSASIVINGGAAITTNRNVTLALSAADAQTGVMSMQISTDGVFDTEPSVPFSTSGSATLPGPFGTKTVYVRYQNNAGMWSGRVSDTITYRAPKPAVTSVSPAAGPLGGGRTVTIHGTHFSGATAVKFGIKPATSFTVVNPTTIRAVTPAHAAGSVHVFVTTPSGTSSAGAADHYTFEAAPTISSVSPNAGPAGGGRTVTITGTHFTGATAVRFGTTPATSFTVVNPTTIHAVTPAHAAGVVKVFVTTPSGTNPAVAGDHYRFN